MEDADLPRSNSNAGRENATRLDGRVEGRIPRDDVAGGDATVVRLGR